MRVPAPADALRVARALLNISQREAAMRANIMQKSISAAENCKSILLETNLALVDFYRSQGIELLGEGLIGEPIRRSGARWLGPDGPTSLLSGDVTFHPEGTEVSFRAARALLDKGQVEVGRMANLSLDVVKDLERGAEARRSHTILREWYQEQGVEFTGWGDVDSRKFYGVGVRWRT